MTEFVVDLRTAGRPFPHFWETCVGSDHASMALRADWQRQMRQAREELGFQRVRFHGLLDDDMGTLLVEQGREIYSFFNIDQIFDYLHSLGMSPLVELSFMPTSIASGKDTVFSYRGNITPPGDMAAWTKLMQRLVDHWECRYGAGRLNEWMVEVWNEPNLKAFWTGSMQDYFELYAATVTTLKKKLPALRVGGPATADNEQITEFLDFNEKRGLPVDFISTHHYPTDAFGHPGDDTTKQLKASHRGVLREEAARVKAQARGKPVYYTEWASSSNPFDRLHDDPYAAAFAVKTVIEMQSLVEGYSYWTFSDLFEENYFAGVPFHGGFGLLTVHGIAKPAYRAFQFLHTLGEEQLHVKGEHATVDVYAFRRPDETQILIANGNLAGHPIKDEIFRLRLHGKSVRAATIERIDSKHANARAAWEEMGSPDSLRAEDLEAIRKRSETGRVALAFTAEGGDLIRDLAMEAQSVALLRLQH